MPEFTIGGIPVSFPFEPYDVQRRYMEKVIECLDRSANSVLESPTGLTFTDPKNISLFYPQNMHFCEPKIKV